MSHIPEYSEMSRGIYRTALLARDLRGSSSNERRLAFDFSALGLAEHEETIIRALQGAGCRPVEGSWLKDILNKPRPKFDFRASVHQFPLQANCVTFTKGMYALKGIQIGRSLTEQLNEGMYVNFKSDYSNVQEGDLVFRRRTKAALEIGYHDGDPENAVAHVGLATGTGTVLHMRGYGENKGLTETPINDFVKPKYGEVRRYVRDWRTIQTFTLGPSIDFERSTDVRTAFLENQAEIIRTAHAASAQHVRGS